MVLCADLLYRTSLEPDNKLCCFSQNLQSLITFFWTFYLLNFIPHMGKISFMPSNKYCFHCLNFHETHNCSMALCVHLYWISPKPIKTYGTCKGKYIYALSTNNSELIFTKPTFAWQHFVKNIYTEFHKNMTDGLFAYTRLYMDRQTWSPHKAFIFYFVRMTENYVMVQKVSSIHFRSMPGYRFSPQKSRCFCRICSEGKYGKTNRRNYKN